MSTNFESSFNPYQPPASGIASVPTTPESEFRLFVIWEKLRLLYNAVLAVETAALMILLHPTRSVLFKLGALVGYCVLANVCFCAGPVLNGYARLAGMRQRAVTISIFVLGTVVSGFLVLIAVMTLGVELFPNLD